MPARSSRGRGGDEARDRRGTAGHRAPPSETGSGGAIAGIVLAAGASTRLGRPKQVLELGGKALVRLAVEAALGAGLSEVVVVLGHRAKEVAAAVPSGPRVRTVVNPAYAEGQSTSLAAGLAAAAPTTAAVVVLLADQPGVGAEAVRAVAEAFLGGAGPVVQAAYGGRPGHPTLLARTVWKAVVAQARGDEGARSVLARHPEWRSLVELGGSPPADIDTEDDYERARAAFGRQESGEPNHW